MNLGTNFRSFFDGVGVDFSDRILLFKVEFVKVTVVIVDVVQVFIMHLWGFHGWLTSEVLKANKC